jgi:exopolyphosphatase / guanosine-5'-triphosphate,3'-diphosphate pyrophosphatase
MNVAAIDIGTNSVRLLITDGAGREVERAMQITRLGQGVDVTGSLHPDAITRTIAVLSHYGARLAHHQVAHVRAAATSAARDAANSVTFFDSAQRALGVRPELLPGDEEARLSFRGATAGLDIATGPFLVIDIGGGSTEFVLGSDAPEALVSLNVGCVRMTERHLTADPPASEQLRACLADVSRELLAVKSSIDVQRARRTIGLAGTVTALAALELGLDHYEAARTHHSSLSLTQVEELFARLSTATLESRRAMLAEPKRADVIVGGAAVLVTIMRELDIPELLVSESDILDGLAASLR